MIQIRVAAVEEHRDTPTLYVLHDLLVLFATNLPTGIAREGWHGKD